MEDLTPEFIRQMERAAADPMLRFVNADELVNYIAFTTEQFGMDELCDQVDNEAATDAAEVILGNRDVAYVDDQRAEDEHGYNSIVAVGLARHMR